MIKHTIYAIFLGMLVFALYLFQYTGAFTSVTVALDQRPEMNVIFKDYKGAYHQIVSTIEEVEAWAKKNGLKCRLSYGEYLDNPNQVEEGRLRARAGCVIDPLVPSEADQFQKLKLKLPEGFKADTVHPMKAVVAVFSGAPGIGPLKVYPKAQDYIAQEKLIALGSVFEIYEIFDAKSMQTTYLWPVQ